MVKNPVYLLRFVSCWRDFSKDPVLEVHEVKRNLNEEEIPLLVISGTGVRIGRFILIFFQGDNWKCFNVPSLSL